MTPVKVATWREASTEEYKALVDIGEVFSPVVAGDSIQELALAIEAVLDDYEAEDRPITYTWCGVLDRPTTPVIREAARAAKITRIAPEE